MTGNNKPGFIIQERDRKLLTEIGMMRITDRDGAMEAGGFGSVTRVNTRLVGLVRRNLLRRTFIGTISGGRKAIYTLSPQGAALVSSRLPGLTLKQDQTLSSSLYVEHWLAISKLYLALKFRCPQEATFARWLSFRTPLTSAIRLKPDGYCELVFAGCVRPLFVEADLGSEAFGPWEKKLQYYLQLAMSGEFKPLFGQERFQVFVVTTTERRQNNIRSLVAKSTNKIFWFTTFQDINREGFFSPIWLRPVGDQKVSPL